MQSSVAKHALLMLLSVYLAQAEMCFFTSSLDCGGDGQACKCISKKMTSYIDLVAAGFLKVCALLQQASSASVLGELFFKKLVQMLTLETSEDFTSH